MAAVGLAAFVLVGFQPEKLPIDDPARTDLGAYRSVVVWCKRFGVPFAAAPVTPEGESA